MMGNDYIFRGGHAHEWFSFEHASKIAKYHASNQRVLQHDI